MPGDKAGYPTTVSFDPVAETLHVGHGAFSPVSPAVWDFTVSGFEPVQSWITNRLAGGAGRHSSLLDDVRPEQWTAEMTEELLRLLWIVEETLDMQAELNQCLADVLDGELVMADDLPSPTEAERRPPRIEVEDPAQATLDIEFP